MENKNSLVPVNTATREQGYFRSFDGLKLFYSVRGPKNAPPLIFCYGLVCSKLQLKYQLEHFEKTHRVIYFDYRGHHNSESPDDASSMTIDSLAKDLASLHEELKLPPCAVLGHSLGVNIVLEFYRMHPERVSALVLANGTPKDPFETMFGHNLTQVLFPLLPLAYELAPDLIGKFWQNQGTSIISQKIVARLGFDTKKAKREDINEYIRLTSKVRTDLFIQLLNDFTHYDACHWLDQVKVPTLVIGGGKDYITPPINARKMAKIIPGAKLKIFPQGSHCVQMEEIVAVNSLIEDFLSNNARKKRKDQLVKERRAKAPA
jgi:pimeloyl-ACP methyl ester carboxylesterase